MAETLVVEPINLDARELLEAVGLLLRLNAVVYLPVDGLGASGTLTQWCAELQRRLVGARVTYLPVHALSGPIRMYGHERLRIENKEGAQ